MKNKEVCNKTRSLPSSILFKGQGTEHTTVKWSIPKDSDAGLTAVGYGSVVGDEF